MTESREKTRPVSFKMPLRVWAVVQAAATANAVDVSSVLNAIVAQNLPVLVRLQAQRDAALAIARSEGMAAAVMDRLRQIEVEEGRDASFRSLNDLLSRLQAPGRAA